MSQAIVRSGILAVVLLSYGCLIEPPGGVTDVPCIDPYWPDDIDRFLLRPDGAGGLLLTAQTPEEVAQDVTDDHVDYVPHQGLVYHIAPTFDSIQAVDSSTWDSLTGPVQDCCPSLLEEGPLTIQANQLFFQGRLVPVAGGTALDMDDAPRSAVAAVLSTNGRQGLFSDSSGQHYHQLYSLVDGRAIGPLLRLSVGGFDNGRVFIGWSDDESFVLYENGGSGKRIARLCIVPVAEELQNLQDNVP